MTGDLNWYDLYRPKYGEGLAAEERYGKSMINGKEVVYRRGRTFREATPFLKTMIGEAKPGEIESVIGVNASDYFNNEEVRIAMHTENYTGEWAQCSNGTTPNNHTWNYHVQPEASLWIYPILKAAGIRILFYSGDTDGAVGLAGTR